MVRDATRIIFRLARLRATVSRLRVEQELARRQQVTPVALGGADQDHRPLPALEPLDRVDRRPYRQSTGRVEDAQLEFPPELDA